MIAHNDPLPEIQITNNLIYAILLAVMVLIVVVSAAVVSFQKDFRAKCANEVEMTVQLKRMADRYAPNSSSLPRPSLLYGK